MQRQLEDWGFLVVNEAGKLVDASPDFCFHFSVVKSEVIGTTITEMIKRASKNHFHSGAHGQVFFGVILGYSCLIRHTKKDTHDHYRVILRHDEVNLHDLNSLINAIEKPKRMKKSTGSQRYSFDEIIGESQLMAQMKELAARIATSNSTVLLTGESGTGKELFAQAIHGLSSRKNQPFIAVNCAAIPDELFESEVFGYEPGAFSGAKKEGKPGKIELAQNGTLFLDEISELPYQAQGKLLRVLQEREVERLGGTSSKNVDIRIITATNRDLKTLVQQGKFRQDLFYRLYVFELKIPSLRQRKEDILPLAYYFMDDFNEKLGCHVDEIAPELQEWMLSFEWPGNVRELKAVIERGMYIATGNALTFDCVGFSPLMDEREQKNESSFVLSLEEEVRKAEISAIQRALKNADGDRTKAAQLLQIHLASLYRKMAKYKLK